MNFFCRETPGIKANICLYLSHEGILGSQVLKAEIVNTLLSQKAFGPRVRHLSVLGFQLFSGYVE